MPHETYHDVKQRYKDTWLDMDGVEAVGVTDDGIVITISDATLEFAAEIDDVPIHTEFGGGFEALAHASDVNAKPERDITHRPIVGGVSVGRGTNTMGTSSFVLEDPDTGDRYLSSNNHVIAGTNAASPGDPIHQPGPRGERVGHLKDYVPLKDGVTVDLAWAKINDDAGLSAEIHEFDQPNTPVEATVPSVGDPVWKSGITTGVTTAEVTRLDTAVNVRYGDDTTYRIDHCILTEAMTEPGDSGSPVIDKDGNPAGMSFAGSDTHTILMAPDQIEQHSGMRIRRLNTPLEDDTPPTATVTFELERTPEEDDDEDEEPTHGQLTATLLDKDTGFALNGTVSVDHAEGTTSSSTDNGKATLTVSLAEEMTVTATATGYETAQKPINPEAFST